MFCGGHHMGEMMDIAHAMAKHRTRLCLVEIIVFHARWARMMDEWTGSGHSGHCRTSPADCSMALKNRSPRLLLSRPTASPRLDASNVWVGGLLEAAALNASVSVETSLVSNLCEKT